MYKGFFLIKSQVWSEIAFSMKMNFAQSNWHVLGEF